MKEDEWPGLFYPLFIEPKVRTKNYGSSFESEQLEGNEGQEDASD